MGPPGPPQRDSASDDDVPNEPPPACASEGMGPTDHADTPSAAQASAQTLESGPSRPFQDAPSHHQSYHPPAPDQPYRPPQDPQEEWAQTYGRPSIDGAAGGSGLFSPYPPQAPLPGHERPPLAQSASPPPPSRPTSYAPTTVPTPGQPLLHEGKLLVFSESGHRPSHHSVCSKCADTGFKVRSAHHGH